MAWWAHEGVDSTVGTISSTSHLGSSVNLDVFNNEGIYFKTLKETTIRYRFKNLARGFNLSWVVRQTLTLTSALDSAFLRRSRTTVALFLGQAPREPEVLKALAWACLPTPPMNRLIGMICFLATTSLRYFWAFLKCIPLTAWATSLEVLKWVLRWKPLALTAEI